MGRLRGGAMLATVAFMLAAPASAVSFDTAGLLVDDTAADDDALKPALMMKVLNKVALRFADTVQASQKMRGGYRTGPSQVRDEYAFGGTSLLGAPRMFGVAPGRMSVRHPSARKIASQAGMWTADNNDKALTLVAGTVLSDLGVRFIARPMGQEMRLSPWSTKHGTGFAANFAF